VSELIPCPGCQRHVQSNEAACPFCGGALSAVSPCNGRCSGPTAARVAKAALVAAGAAILGAACGSSPSVIVPYGVPPQPDAGMQSHSDAGEPADTAPDGTDGSK